MNCPVCETPECLPFLSAEDREYWRCGQCHATFVHPARLPCPDVELQQYLLHRNRPDDSGYRRFLHRLAEPLLERLPLPQRGLDYGCGPGPALAAMLREAGHEVALYDPHFQPDRNVLAETYDFITCTEVAEHFHRPADEFRKLDPCFGRAAGWL